MAAPSAPVITFRGATVGSVRLRWRAVDTAATYKVYRDAVHTGQTLTAVAGWNEAVVTCGPLDSLTVTAINSGAEESAASNAIVIQGMGTAESFPPKDARNTSDPFGAE